MGQEPINAKIGLIVTSFKTMHPSPPYTSDGIQNAVTYTQSGQSTIAYTTTAFNAYGSPLTLTESVGGNTITDTFTYDSQGRTTAASANYAGLTNQKYSLAWTYGDSGTTAGMLTALALNKQNGSGGTLTPYSVAYAYNNAGQLATITGQTGTASTTASLAYNLGTGAPSSLTTALPGDDLVTSYQYNASTGLLEHVTTMRGSTNVYEEDLYYPAAGTAHYDQVSRKQITKRLESGGTATTQHFYTCYSYDSLNQLTDMTTYSGVYGSTESHTTLASG
jgi:hypothetical protein